jgi:hypothetical protein
MGESIFDKVGYERQANKMHGHKTFIGAGVSNLRSQHTFIGSGVSNYHIPQHTFIGSCVSNLTHSQWNDYLYSRARKASTILTDKFYIK